MTKITLTVQVDVFSLDAVPAILTEVAQIISRETESGHIDKEDGDHAEWKTQRRNVLSIVTNNEGGF